MKVVFTAAALADLRSIAAYLERFQVDRKRQPTVIAGLDPAIRRGPEMAGSSPAMTKSGCESSLPEHALAANYPAAAVAVDRRVRLVITRINRWPESSQRVIAWVRNGGELTWRHSSLSLGRAAWPGIGTA